MTVTKQPEWEFIANIGDVNPIDHGGIFIFKDKTGVYSPEIERLFDVGEDDYGDPVKWKIHRVIMEPCTYINGILSDNQFHPDKCAWFATTPEKIKERPQDGKGMTDLANFSGIPEEELIRDICGDDIIDKAHVWCLIGDCHGWNNLDSYPLYINDREEVEERYKEIL